MAFTSKTGKTPAPMPQAEAMPALRMHGINKKGLPVKAGKPFLLIQRCRGRESTLPYKRISRYLDGFASRMQTIPPQAAADGAE